MCFISGRDESIINLPCKAIKYGYILFLSRKLMEAAEKFMEAAGKFMTAAEKFMAAEEKYMDAAEEFIGAAEKLEILSITAMYNL